MPKTAGFLLVTYTTAPVGRLTVVRTEINKKFATQHTELIVFLEPDYVPLEFWPEQNPYFLVFVHSDLALYSSVTGPMQSQIDQRTSPAKFEHPAALTCLQHIAPGRQQKCCTIWALCAQQSLAPRFTRMRQ